jgi:hypothetical protein
MAKKAVSKNRAMYGLFVGNDVVVIKAVYGFKN